MERLISWGSLAASEVSGWRTGGALRGPNGEFIHTRVECGCLFSAACRAPYQGKFAKPRETGIATVTFDKNDEERHILNKDCSQIFASQDLIIGWERISLLGIWLLYIQQNPFRQKKTEPKQISDSTPKSTKTIENTPIEQDNTPKNPPGNGTVKPDGKSTEAVQGQEFTLVNQTNNLNQQAPSQTILYSISTQRIEVFTVIFKHVIKGFNHIGESYKDDLATKTLLGSYGNHFIDALENKPITIPKVGNVISKKVGEHIQKLWLFEAFVKIANFLVILDKEFKTNNHNESEESKKTLNEMVKTESQIGEIHKKFMDGLSVF
jgi:hypothetical protein